MRMEIRKTSDRPAVLIAVRTSLGMGRGIGEDENTSGKEKKQVSESVPKVQRAFIIHTYTHMSLKADGIGGRCVSSHEKEPTVSRSCHLGD